MERRPIDPDHDSRLGFEFLTLSSFPTSFPPPFLSLWLPASQCSREPPPAASAAQLRPPPRERQSPTPRRHPWRTRDVVGAGYRCHVGCRGRKSSWCRRKRWWPSGPLAITIARRWRRDGVCFAPPRHAFPLLSLLSSGTTQSGLSSTRLAASIYALCARSQCRGSGRSRRGDPTDVVLDGLPSSFVARLTPPHGLSAPHFGLVLVGSSISPFARSLRQVGHGRAAIPSQGRPQQSPPGPTCIAGASTLLANPAPCSSLQ